MTESELYKELGTLTKTPADWGPNIPYVSSLLAGHSVKIQAKALWLLGEMGLRHPDSIHAHLPAIAAFCNSDSPLLRARSITALGRIGRCNFLAIAPFWADLFRFATDADATVRLSFIWASENIATNTPDPYEASMPIFAQLLHDPDDKVRMEAPEIFRVLGKRRPAFVRPYLPLLRTLSETDPHPVVRIHSLAALKASVPLP